MQATGNDFIICDWRHGQATSGLAALSQQMADRHFGVGADQILFVQNSLTCDAQMLVFNADGSEAEMSGNGMRCFAKFLFDNQIVKKRNMTVETLAGVIRPDVVALDADGKAIQVRVDMGPAQSYVRMKLKSAHFVNWDKGNCIETSDLAPDELWIHCVSMGNPHAVLFVRDVNAVPLEIWGPVIEYHPNFANRTNFEVVALNADQKLNQRTWERGAAETLACGTGACAVVKTVIETHKMHSAYDVHLRGGVIAVEQDARGHMLQAGAVQLICKGEFFTRVDF